MVRRLSCIAVALSVAIGAAAQPHLVKDIVPGFRGEGSTPYALGTIGNTTFFEAITPDRGRELWKTDGTVAGTTLVKDINPGRADSQPVNGMVVGTHLFFYAASVVPQEFWTSDGTEAGTMSLGARPAPQTLLSNGLVIGSTLYFKAWTAATGEELWRTDGTRAGTAMVADLRPGAASSSITILTGLGSLLLFAGTDGTQTGVFSTDGTAAGTHFVAPLDAREGVAFGSVAILSVVSGTETTLVRTDGTAAGTAVIRGGFTGAAMLRRAGSSAYFVGRDTATGSELWRTDGTAAGTALVTDLTPGAESTHITRAVALGDRLAFTVLTGTIDNEFLWITDGTAGGTLRLGPGGSSTTGPAVSGRYVYYEQEDATGRILWRTDGTVAGTERILNAGPAPTYYPATTILARPGGVFFGASTAGTGFEPWVSDGTPAGTHPVANLTADTPGSSSPSDFANLNGRLLFRAYDGTRVRLYLSDGTADGTVPIPGGYVEPRTPAVVSGGVYYFSDEHSANRELWRTDGSEAETFRLFGDPLKSFTTPVAFRDGVLFIVSDFSGNSVPWFTDGTVAGTRMLLTPPAGGSFRVTRGPDVSFSERYAFFAVAMNGAEQFWETDGTPERTVTMQTFPVEWRVASDAARVGDWYYFITPTYQSSFSLARVNAGTGETQTVKQFSNSFYRPNMIWPAGNQVLFFLDKDQLWRSDGTAGGTQLVRTGVPQSQCNPGRQTFATADGILYWFVIPPDPFGVRVELWRSDGTAAGSYPLATGKSDYGSESLQTCSNDPVVAWNGRLYFTGADPVHGAELWESDGTVAGTHLVWDVNPGPVGSDPTELLPIGNMLYFRATGPEGTELWALPAPCGRDCPPHRRSAQH